jgi:hypothetical protein
MSQAKDDVHGDFRRPRMEKQQSNLCLNFSSCVL